MSKCGYFDKTIRTHCYLLEPQDVIVKLLLHCPFFVHNVGSKWEYTSWEKNQPDNAGGTEQRVETNFRDVFGKWNDGDGNNKRAFFCQYTLKGI